MTPSAQEASLHRDLSAARGSATSPGRQGTQFFETRQSFDSNKMVRISDMLHILYIHMIYIYIHTYILYIYIYIYRYGM